MTRTYSVYIEGAQAMLDAGFTSKAAQKDALDYCNRAYECVRSEIHDQLLRVDTLDRNHAWQTRYYDGLPYSLAHFRPKHAALFPDMPERMQQINAAVALRDKIKAAPVVKAAPVRTAKQREADEKARTCQICARHIFAETGVIAHHGYERPGDGYQTSSCGGARKLPYECSCDTLKEHVRHERNHLQGMMLARSEIEMETRPVSLSYQVNRKINGQFVYARGSIVSDKIFVDVTRETFEDLKAKHSRALRDVATFDALKATDLEKRSREIDSQRTYIKQQQARVDAWVQRETWNNTTAKWEPVK